MGTSAVSGRSVVEFSEGTGAPEGIRTADPQIRSLGVVFENFWLCSLSYPLAMNPAGSHGIMKADQLS
jgi:hypothetical protein